jgi:cellulose synthase/poly-beta-1,6-N-acetylglucosamine synthase-like glycosyltransferase
MGYLLFSLLLALGYALTIRFYLTYWHRLPAWSGSASALPELSVAVLIPVRNESANIAACLHSILHQDYSHFDVWVIDDHSTDQTIAIVKKMQAQHPRLKLLRLADFPPPPTPAFKKYALQIAIDHTEADLIVTTDGDCLAPRDWLRQFAAFVQETQAVFVAAPVVFHQESNVLERFQSLDFLGMMLITGAGISSGRMHMSNGANLAYLRTAFEQVGGFAGIDQLASGDDILLMQKMTRRFPGRVRFLKSPAMAVKTSAQPTLHDFIQQRIRWGTKSTQYPDVGITLILALVFFFCCNILLSVLLLPFLGIWALAALVLQLLSKGLADFLFLKTATRFFGRTDLLRQFLPAQLLHILYIAGIGTASNLRKSYHWKGRRVR